MPTVMDVLPHDRLISFQFSFSNLDAVPPFLRGLPLETPEEAGARRQLRTGQRVYQGKDEEKVSLQNLPLAIVNSNLVLVNAQRQERYQPNRDTFAMIRFIFVQKDFLDDKSGDDEFQRLQKWRGIIMGEMQVVCSLALWRVRSFRNPLYRDGVEVEGASALSINFEGRTPLYDHDTFLVDIQPEHNPVLGLEIS